MDTVLAMWRRLERRSTYPVPTAIACTIALIATTAPGVSGTVLGVAAAVAIRSPRRHPVLRPAPSGSS